MLLYHKIHHVQEGMRRQHFANFLIIVLVGQHCLCRCVCMCGFCNLWVCECVGFVMWVCVCVGFVMCGCVNVWDL
jgi:hypothetical protein